MAAVLFTKGLNCMHWHARVASSVVLALTLLMTQSTQYVCVCYEQRGTFIMPFPRSAQQTCAAAGLGIQEITLETRQTCSGAAGPAPDLRHQLPSSTHHDFCKQKVGVGYARYIYIYRIRILLRVYPKDMK